MSESTPSQAEGERYPTEDGTRGAGTPHRAGPEDPPRTSPSQTEGEDDGEGGLARGLAPSALDDTDLLRELETLHRTRHDTFLHGSEDALDAHSRRTAELEEEYVRRHPQRLVTADRTRAGARARQG